MFLKCGCGCVVIPVDSKSFEKKDWIVRLVDYCGDTDGLAISSERRLGDHILQENIAKAYFLSPDESKPYLEQLSKLVSDGHRYAELSRVLRSATREG